MALTHRLISVVSTIPRGLKNSAKSSDDERRVETQEAQVKRDQVIGLHQHFAVMKSVEVLTGYRILTEEDSMLLITWMQFLDPLPPHEFFVELFHLERLTVLIVDHEVEGGDLVGD